MRPSLVLKDLKSANDDREQDKEHLYHREQDEEQLYHAIMGLFCPQSQFASIGPRPQHLGPAPAGDRHSNMGS